ncbi:DUF4132 domain-containing protein [Actinoplanes xinjiangensis]|uniref:DUF4132 domain-containing protein n=1 Tax=Actinoplanes xinjiangensis TaxID=512350 RepID=UPI00341D6869
MTTVEVGAFDAEAALRLAIAGSRERMQTESSPADIEQQFVTGMVGVCGWSGEPVEALLAAVSEPPLAAGQLALLPEVRRRAETLSSAVAALRGTAAGHDERVSAVHTMLEHTPGGRIPGGGADPVWYAMYQAVNNAEKDLLGGQPAAVRQTLLEAWTVPEKREKDRSALIRRLVRPGDLDGSGWLDRLGGRAVLRFGDWAWGLRTFTWQSLRTAHTAGRPHAAALATWRRTRVDDDPREADDTSDAMWPIPNIGEPWADRAIADIEALPADRRAAWHDLLVHCPAERDKARPGTAWLKKAQPLLDAVGADEFTARVDDWLPLVGLARTLPLRMATCCPWHYADHPPRLIDRYNVGLLLGLIRLRMTLPPSEETLRSLGRIAERAARKVAGHGPASPKLANAAATALVDTQHPKALAQLARLSSRLTYKSTLTIVQKGLARHAEALGVSREDVEEMALPGFGLPLAGTLDDTAYEVEVRGVTAAVVWRSAAGKVLKAPPTQVREEHGEEVKELTAAAKDIAAALLATRDRLEGMLRRDRSWTGEQWRTRFLDHPLAETLARRLIWTVDGMACCWTGDTLRTVDDTAVEPADDATVRLWHPVGAKPAEIALWRDFLTRHGITQPFKQAHRERYLLTDAERATGTYSNRFAAHIVLQHRLNAVLSRRGWAYVRHLQDGSHYDPPSLTLPDWDLRAELAVAGIDVDDGWAFDTMATDQLSFLGADRAPVPLEQVPAVVLSEVMRDADLFVTVAGIGSDPTWYDGGRDGRHRDYWGRSALGDLTQSGETRRDVLAEIIPRLAVADRCTVTDMYLEVRGDLHTYRIHCGSGNILIAPENRYLCIIPDSAKAARQPTMYLPFEGDSRLSEILSKALLLAADKKIKDPVILRQLHPDGDAP